VYGDYSERWCRRTTGACRVKVHNRNATTLGFWWRVHLGLAKVLVESATLLDEGLLLKWRHKDGEAGLPTFGVPGHNGKNRRPISAKFTTSWAYMDACGLITKWTPIGRVWVQLVDEGVVATC